MPTGRSSTTAWSWWDDLDNGADLSSLVGSLNDEDDVWSDYRTHYNDEDRSSGSNPVPGPQISRLNIPGAHQLGNRRTQRLRPGRRLRSRSSDPRAAR